MCRWQSRHLKGSNEAKLELKQTGGPRAPRLAWDFWCEWARCRRVKTMCLFFTQKGKGRPHEAENQETAQPTSCGS